MTEPPCRLCHANLPKKQRRTIFSETFGVLNQLVEVIDEVPQRNDGHGNYVCGLCWNKFNRLSKIEHDLKTKLKALKEERLSLLKTLREKHGAQPFISLTPKSKKHYIVHSPTPRKAKKSLTLTPQRGHQDSAEATIEKQKIKREKVSIQLFSPGKVKVGNLHCLCTSKEQ